MSTAAFQPPSSSDASGQASQTAQGNKNAFVPALMVIDMQNDFVTGSLAIPEAPSIIGTINSLLDLPWKIKIATRDFHPDNHISFAKTHQKQEFSKATVFHPEDQGRLKGMEQILWPVHCVAYTGGADFVAGLNAEAFDVVVHKGTHAHIESYSAFKDIWGKSTTELPDIVAECGITDIFIVGLAGDYCVKYTAIDSVEYGYQTWLITDGIKSVASEDLAYEEMKQKGIHMVTSEEIKRRLQSGARN